MQLNGGYMSTPLCVDKMVLIFCSSSRFTVSGTNERAFGVTCLTIFSTFTLPPSSLITSRHSSRTSSFQPHSVNRKRNKSFSLEICKIKKQKKETVWVKLAVLEWTKMCEHVEKTELGSIGLWFSLCLNQVKMFTYLARSPCNIVVWSTAFVSVMFYFVEFELQLIYCCCCFGLRTMLNHALLLLWVFDESFFF